jgi:hypothetical protein
MRRKNSSHSGDIEDLKRQNQILEGQVTSLTLGRTIPPSQIKALEKAKSSGHFASAASVLHTAHSLGGSEVRGEGGGETVRQ